MFNHENCHREIKASYSLFEQAETIVNWFVHIIRESLNVPK